MGRCQMFGLLRQPVAVENGNAQGDYVAIHVYAFIYNLLVSAVLGLFSGYRLGFALCLAVASCGV
jgi:hypothetical protein